MSVDRALWNRVAADRRFDEEQTVRSLVRKYCAERDFYKDRMENRELELGAVYEDLLQWATTRIDTARTIEKLIGGQKNEADEA